MNEIEKKLKESLLKIGVVDTTPIEGYATLQNPIEHFQYFGLVSEYLSPVLENLLQLKTDCKNLGNLLNFLLKFNGKSYISNPLMVLVSHVGSTDDVLVRPTTAKVDLDSGKLILSFDNNTARHMNQLLVWRTGARTSSIFFLTPRDIRRGEVPFHRMLNKKLTRSILNSEGILDAEVKDMFEDFKPSYTPPGTTLVSNNWVSTPDTNLIFKIE